MRFNFRYGTNAFAAGILELQAVSGKGARVSVNIHIHKTHRRCTDGKESVEVEGSTVRECLEALVDRFPDMEKELFGKKGDLRNLIEIYINLESAYPNELAKPVKDGDEIYITFMLAGG